MSDPAHPTTPDPTGAEPTPSTSEASAIPADAGAGAGSVALPAAETVEEAQAVAPPAAPEAAATTAAAVAELLPQSRTRRRPSARSAAASSRLGRSGPRPRDPPSSSRCSSAGSRSATRRTSRRRSTTALPVTDPATAGNQASPVVREFIAAVATNDADADPFGRAVGPYKLFTYEMERWSFQEVTSVDTSRPSRTGTGPLRNSCEWTGPTGNPITINLVVETEDGNIVSFRVNRLRGFGSHLAFVWDKNLLRLLIVLMVLTALIRRTARSRSSRPRRGHRRGAGVRAPAVLRGLVHHLPVRDPVLVPVPAAQVHRHAGRPADRPVVRELPRPAGPAGACQDHGRHPARRQGVRAPGRRDAQGHAALGPARDRQDVPRGAASPRRPTCRSSTSTRARCRACSSA